MGQYSSFLGYCGMVDPGGEFGFFLQSFAGGIGGVAQVRGGHWPLGGH